MWLLILSLFFILPRQIKAAVPPLSLPTADTNIPYVGAFYMPGFKLGTPIPGWRGIENFDPTRKPLLGYFDEGNPETMDWEIKWALENGINFFIFDWFRCANGTDVKCDDVLGKPITPDKLMYSASLHEGFLKSSFQNQMKFAIMLTRHGDGVPLFSDENDLKNNLLPFIINNYLKKSNYLKINNRPLLFFFGTENLDDSSGNNKIDSRIIRIIRDTVKQSGLAEPYLIAEDRGFTARKIDKSNSYKTIGYDHVFSYWPEVYQSNGEYFWQKAASITEDQALAGMKESYNWLKSNQVLPFIANANPMANGVNQPLWTISPSKYEQLITYLKSSIIPNITNSDLSKKVIITDAWNEITEGHWISPTNKYGFDYLKSIRNILTQKNNNPNYSLPLQNGFGPYDSQYQNLMKRVVSPSVFENSEFTFNNDGNYKIADKSPTGNTEKLSFGAWFNSINPQSIGLSNFIPLQKGYGSLHLVISSSGYGHCAISTDKTPWYPPGGGTTAGWNSTQFKFGQWHHLFCVYDGSKLYAYVDGVKTGTSTINVTGKTSDPYNDFIFGINYQGKIAKLKIVKEAYTDSQVNALYESTKIFSTPTPTRIPSSTPTLPPSLCSPCPNLPQAKSKGDSDCSGTTTLNDYSIWRSEYVSSNKGVLNKNNWHSDYNCDGKTNLTDALIWKVNFIKGL